MYSSLSCTLSHRRAVRKGYGVDMLRATMWMLNATTWVLRATMWMLVRAPNELLPPLRWGLQKFEPLAPHYVLQNTP
eukprot:431520-Prorocentrum_minimum.AAC.2